MLSSSNSSLARGPAITDDTGVDGSGGTGTPAVALGSDPTDSGVSTPSGLLTYSGALHNSTPFSGNQDIDATLYGSKWNSLNLTYSFPTAKTQYQTNYGSSGSGGFSTNPAGFVAFNAAQQTAARYALGLISSYTNLTFTSTTESDTNHATIRFAQTSDFSLKSAHAEFPSDVAQAGDVWLGTGSDPKYGPQPFYLTPAKGNWGQATIMHELGHAMGLKHGHENYTYQDLSKDLDVTGPRYGSDALPSNHDGQDWSLMTYRSNPGGGTGFEGDAFNQPQTYMQDDIAALQYMYGANYNTNSGNTVYTWSPTTGQEFINGVGQGAPTSNKISMTVWDGGGNDTYDLSNYATNLSINLQPGAFSTFSTAQLVNHQPLDGNAPAVGNIANALLYQGNVASLIDNATGGSGADTFTGNSAINILEGNGGADTFTGAGGSDIFKDTGANHNNDSITDFARGDDIWVTDGAVSSFTFNYNAATGALSFAEGGASTYTMQLSAGLTGVFGKTADSTSGVDLELYAAPTFTGIAANAASTEQVAGLLNAGAAITDASLDQLNGGAGDYAGASVTLGRDGGSSTDDVFDFAANADFTASNGVLSAAGATFGTYSLSGGLLDIAFTSMSATSALVDDVLKSITYEDANDAPPASVKVDYTYTGPSGPGFVAAGQTLVAITAVNDAPTVSAPTAGTYQATEKQALNLQNAGLTVGDPDDPSGTVGTETVTLSAAEGTLTATAGTTAVAITGQNTGTLVLNGTLAQIDTILHGGAGTSLTYTDALDDPSASTVLTVAVDDGGFNGTGGAKTAQATTTIAITPVNQAPTATVPATPLQATEQTGLSLKNAGLSIGDPDGTDSPETVTLTVGEGTLTAQAGTSGVLFGSNTNGTSSLTVTGTVAQIDAFLNTDGASTLTYVDPSDAPSTSTSLVLAVNDGAAPTTTAASTIAIQAVNDGPMASVPSGGFSATGSNAVSLAGAGLSVSDIDGESGVETATLTVSEGALSGAAGTTGATLGSTGGTSLTISGTLAQINAVLGGSAGSALTFSDASANPASGVALTLAIDDGGNTGTGGNLKGSAATTIAVAVPAQTVSIASVGSLTGSAKQTITGSATTAGFGAEYTAGTLVEIDDNGTAIGQGTIQQDGSFSVAVTLAAQGSNSLTAVETDTTGRRGQSGSVQYTLDTTPPAVAFDPLVSFSSPRTATLTGTVSDNAGVASVEIFEGDTDLGAATVNADNTWNFTDELPRGGNGGFSARATDTSGNTTSAAAPYVLQTALRGSPGQRYTATEDLYGASGDLLSTTFFERDGTVLFSSRSEALPNGGSSYTYSNGAYFDDKPYTSFTDVYRPDGELAAVHQTDNVNGTHTLIAEVSGVTLTSQSNDTMVGIGNRDRFVFTPGFGQDTIENFKASGPNHDTVVLSSADFAGFADVLRHTAATADGAVIHDPTSGDTLLLAGVSKAEMAHSRKDFTFHA